jgi:hypothetical protein
MMRILLFNPSTGPSTTLLPGLQYAATSTGNAATFALAHLIDGFAKVVHDVKLVE